MKNINLNGNLDLSKSLNEIISNTLKNPSKQVGTSINTILEFFNNTFLYPMQKYNIYAEKKLEQFKNELILKMKNIPEKKLTDPNINILGPTLEALKYNLNEEYIKEMFTNLLLADINKDTKSDVSPAYIEIIKQLSSLDAKIISTILGVHDIGFYNLYEIKAYKTNSDKYSSTEVFAIRVINLESPIFIPKAIFIPAIVLDNLKRLGIMEVKLISEKVKDIFSTRISEALIEEEMFPKWKDREYGADIHLIYFTKFGRKFADICTNKEYRVYNGFVGRFELPKRRYTRKIEQKNSSV